MVVPVVIFSQTSHSVTVAVAVQVPFMLLCGQPLGLDVGGETMLEFELEQIPKDDWQPAMQYCGPEPLEKIVRLGSNLASKEKEGHLLTNIPDCCSTLRNYSRCKNSHWLLHKFHLEMSRQVRPRWKLHLG